MERLNPKAKRQNRLYRFLSFLIPFAAMMLCLAVSEYYPFGEDSVFRGDAYAQFYPYIVMFRRILRSHESLLYTWRSGLGISLLPTASYYFFNPFNLIAVFLPESVLPGYFSVVICLRMGFCGCTFSYLLQTIRRELTPSAVAFSTMFALNAWMIGSMHQFVWIDSVVMLPLVCAGLVRAVRDRDCRLYPLAIGLCIAFNYYMGFIVCVMTGLCWIALLIILKKPLRSLWKEALRFLGLSAVGAGLGSVMLIPTFLALRQTQTYGASILSWTEFYASAQQMIGGLCPFLYILLNSHPGFFATSILAVMLLGGYLVSGRIPLRERLCGIGLFLFLMLSIAYAPLNFVWHALHYPHISVQRFGFLVPFLLALIGWRYTETLHDAPLKPQTKAAAVLRTASAVILMAGFAAGVIFCAVEYSTLDVPLIVAVCGGLYLLLYAFFRFFPKRKFVFYAFLTLLVSCETGLSAYLQNNGLVESTMQSILPDSAVVQSAAVIRSDDDRTPDSLHRTAMTLEIAGSDMEMLYDIPQGSSVFSSLIPDELGMFCEMMGYDRTGYAFSFRDTTPFARQLLDVQYVISEEPASAADPMQDDQKEEKTFQPYRSKYDADFGFCTADTVQLPESDTLLGCDAQDILFREMTGIDESMFTVIAEKEVTAECMEYQHEGDLYSMQCDELAEELVNDRDAQIQVRPTLQVVYQIPEDGDYFLYYRWGTDSDYQMKQCDLLVNDQAFFKERPGFYRPLDQQCCSPGKVKKGDQVTLVMNMYPNAKSDLYLRLVRFEHDVFRKGYEIMHRSPLRLTSFAQSNFTGTVTAEQDSVLYLSLPYDTGWTAYVDGSAVPVERMLNAMSGIRVSAGTHEIRMQFVPPGLIAGAAASGVCLVCYLVLVLVQSIRIRRERTAVQSVPESANDEENEAKHEAL